MKPHPLKVIVFLALFLIFLPQKTFAHGGGHEKQEQKVETPVDSMYSTKESDAEPSSLGLDDMFSPTDLFTEDELGSPDPLPESKNKMEGSHNEHAEHEEKHVELSHHKQVSSSSKGYGVAVGITFFAGLAFAGLSFIRPGEK